MRSSLCTLSLLALLAACTTTINAQSGAPSDPDNPPPPPSCGDATVNAGEECDDGNTNNADGCTNQCTLPACGDGVLSPPEECDDQNLQSGDGCDNQCNLEQPSTTALLITSPASGEAFEREEFNSAFEFVTAPIVFTSVATDATITTVEYVTENDFSLGTGTAPDFEVSSPFRIDGNRTITAHGRNAAGVEVATAVVQFVVNPPVDEACLARLTQAGVNFTQEAPTLGIHTPVRFLSPMKGITYIPFGASGPRASGELASCLLVEALVNASPQITAKGIDKIEHLGIYNFRCIGGGDPTSGTCTPSQHAFANGIDLHEFRNPQGQTFNVETDFVIDADGATCTAATSNAADQLLHQIACAIHNATTMFHIVLTPNFNSDHRNHFHVDITPGSNFIRSLRLMSEAIFGVDPTDTGMIGD